MLAVRRSLMVCAALLTSVVCASCQADGLVSIAVNPNGSGIVTVSVELDADAVAQLGGNLDTALQLDDVTAAGWNVDRSASKGGGETVSATKKFARPSELQSLLNEVGGEGDSKLLAGWKLGVADNFTTTAYRLDGTVNLTGSLDQFSDGQVAAALDGFATGRSPDELAAALKDNPKAFTLSLTTAMPAEIDSTKGLSAKGLSVNDRPSESASTSWVVGDGKASVTKVSVSATSTDRTPVLLVMLGGVCVVLAAVLLMARRRSPMRKPPSRGSAVRAASAAPASSASAAPTPSATAVESTPLAPPEQRG